ncbi:MAG: 1,6-anhydro-N-acetylmuramyl-L-alanine amidase AmpD [Burkholderiales bacterium]
MTEPPRASRASVAIQSTGWHPWARRIASPNHDQRPAGAEIELVVVHGISLPPGQFGGPFVEQLFTNRLDPTAHPYFAQLADLRVSAHFFIPRDGALRQFVSCSDRAWHAGRSSWRGREACNDFSIGVELEGTDQRAYTARQYGRLATLLRDLAGAYPRLRSIAGHEHVAPGRKTDPGPVFDWSRTARMSGFASPQRN